MRQQRNLLSAAAALLLILGISIGFAADQPHLYRISLEGRGDAVELAAAEIDILAAIPGDHALAELSDDQMTRVIRMGYPVQYLAASLYEYSQLDETDDYYTYTTLTAQLQTWSEQYSNIAFLYDLATTVQNRHVYALKISDNPALEEDEIVNFFVGVHHGNEKISAEVPMYFLNYILTNYGVNPNVTAWVDNHEIWVIPVANPDGYVNNSRYNANNVDINRNYSFHWGQSASNYGPYPFSEVETQAIRDLNLAHHFTTGHSYHSYGEEILYPFAWAANHPSPDNSFFVEMVNAMCAINQYTPLLSGNLYPHGGEMNDYLYGEKGVMSVTTELWSGPGYNPPASGILAVCQENLPTDLYQLQRSEEAQITGLITDASTNAPLVAQVKVVELWNPAEIYPRYSEPNFGRYRHLVVPGTYTLEVSKDGYATQTIPGIVVTSGAPTVRNVALQFIGYPDVGITLTPINPPITIPASGGTFNFNANLTNGETSTQTFSVWIMVQLPNSSWYGPVLGPLNLTLPGSTSIVRMRSQSVPGSAPAGNYLYEGQVGMYPNEIWDSSSFNFTKSSSGTGDNVKYWANHGDLFEDWMTDYQLSRSARTSLSKNAADPLLAAVLSDHRTAQIRYTLPESGRTSLKIYDLQGRLIMTLLDAVQEAGVHEARWTASSVASGIYFCRLQTDSFASVAKIVLLK